MAGVRRITHTVACADLLGAGEQGADCGSRVRPYIHALYDAVERAYPGAKVTIVELRPGHGAAVSAEITCVEAACDEEAERVRRHIRAMAEELRRRGEWRARGAAA